MYYDDYTWSTSSPEDLWVFDKLIVSRLLGYNCGPVGVSVPTPNYYIVRPITNILGMGRGAEIVWIEHTTDHLPPGTFWCEVFTGRHFSVDYINGGQQLCVEGFREENAPLYKWSKWERVEHNIPYPHILKKIYPLLNCEFIGDKLIEIHFRMNPDWESNPSVLIPVWEGDSIEPPEGMVFIDDPDYKRLGFFVTNECPSSRTRNRRQI